MNDINKGWIDGGDASALTVADKYAAINYATGAVTPAYVVEQMERARQMYSQLLWEALDTAHSYTDKCNAYHALLNSGDISPVEFERLMGAAAHEEMARTGTRERYS